MQKTQKNVLQRRITATVENIFARPNSAWGIIFIHFFGMQTKTTKIGLALQNCQNEFGK